MYTIIYWSINIIKIFFLLSLDDWRLVLLSSVYSKNMIVYYELYSLTVLHNTNKLCILSTVGGHNPVSHFPSFLTFSCLYHYPMFRLAFIRFHLWGSLLFVSIVFHLAECPLVSYILLQIMGFYPLFSITSKLGLVHL